ncbi:MAG: peptidylprolyl isomerase [Fimbriimonas sp.]
MNLFPVFCALLALQGPKIPSQHLPDAPLPGKVLAKVDGVEIRAGDVEALLWDWRGYDVLQDLISFQLIRAEAEKKGVSVPEIEVLKIVDDQINATKASLPKDKDLDTALRERGFPRSRLYMRVKTDLMLQRIAEKEFQPAKFFLVSTMLFKPKSATAADVADAVKRAEAAFKRLGNGEKWEDVLKSTQEVQGLVESKGRLGWRTIDAFPEPTITELATAKAGDLTKPVQTGSGIQFFRIDSLGKDAKDRDLEEIRELYMANSRTEILERIKRKGKVDILR